MLLPGNGSPVPAAPAAGERAVGRMAAAACASAATGQVLVDGSQVQAAACACCA